MARMGPLVVVAALGLGCAPAERGTNPPTHEQLVNHHLQGKYAEVISWCPVVLENGDSAPALSDWCMFAYPAALHLSLDTRGALAFVRTVCRDITGQPKGEQRFRDFYVEETSRWVGLPMRMQKREYELQRGLYDTIGVFSDVCSVDPEPIRRSIDTRIKKRRELR